MNAADSRRLCHRNYFTFLFLIGALFLPGGNRCSAEIIFHDFFSQPGNVTNDVPALDVQGVGWRTGSSSGGLQVDPQGHLYNPLTTARGSAGVQLIPIGRDGSFAVSATLKLPTGSTEWIGFGFGNTNDLLAGAGSKSGPWLQVQGNGTITLYGGSGLNNPTTVTSAYTNDGSPVKFVLTYDAYLAAASVAVVEGGVSNSILDTIPVTNSLSSVTAEYLIVQCPTNLTADITRWAADVSVDWFPRPRPLLTLDTPHVITVGDPTGGSDISLIQTALTAAAKFKDGAEVQFTPGATYIIATNTTSSGVPLLLVHGTNVVVNGNGCKILITNPHVGFMDFYLCKNVIVKGFTVDYDPLPFTQGIVTANLNPTEAAFEFRVDPGYPIPTNSYFLEIAQWGTFMDATRPGRLADNHSSIYEFTTVVSTATSNIFKVKLKNRTKLPTIQVGDIWCQLARFNGSTLFRARFSSMVTFLNLTNYTGAAAAFAGNGASLVNEINCQIVIGPPINGIPRVKTTNADGGLFGNPRIGPWVEGCNFIGLSDDVANANTLPFFVVGPVPYSTNTFHLKGYDPGGAIVDIVEGDILVGDDFAFFNGTNGIIFNHAKVTAVNPPYVTFGHPISGIFAGLTTTNTCLFDNSLNSSAVYLYNNFSNSRIHGIYCRANNILIAHNYVTGMGSSAIAAHPALSLAGPNSFVPTNAVIMDNVLADGGVSYEAINNTDPDEEPVWALLQLHKATADSDYVKHGYEISSIRILNNAFLQWRRGAITLHNVSNARIIGNYFSAPMTNDGLTSLSDHITVDLWTCDYKTMVFKDNVKAKPLTDAKAMKADGVFTNMPNAFTTLTAPRIDITPATPSSVFVGWTSPSPAFVLQQAEGLSRSPAWTNLPAFPYVAGVSNVMELPVVPGTGFQLYRASQR